MLDASVIVHQLGDVRISEGDQFLLYLRNLPSKVQEFLQVHRNAVTVQQVKTGVQDYYIRTRVQGDLGSVHVAQPVAGDFFFLHCQIHLAMAPWGATDGRATVPLDPVEDGKFGRQPFFFKAKQSYRTAEPRAVIQISY